MQYITVVLCDMKQPILVVCLSRRRRSLDSVDDILFIARAVQDSVQSEEPNR